MELIDKSEIVAEIKKRIKEHHSGYLVCLKDILSFLDTLEVKEVDLEKEKDDYWNKLCNSEFGELLERDAKWFDDIAKYFFELGLKSKVE